MTASIVRWPAELGARGIAFNERGRSIGGGPSLSGLSQVSAYDAGLWIATVDFRTLSAGARVNAFRAFRARLAGGANHALVPAFDEGQAPWPAAGGFSANLNAEQPWSDGFYFTDGHGWYKPSIVVKLATAAALRATNISVTVTTAGTITAGMVFSFVGGRLKVIEQILDDGSWVIWPPLRVAEIVDAELNFDKPNCKMRLMTEREMDLALGRLWTAQPAAAFIEVVA